MQSLNTNILTKPAIFEQADDDDEEKEDQLESADEQLVEMIEAAGNDFLLEEELEDIRDGILMAATGGWDGAMRKGFQVRFGVRKSRPQASHTSCDATCCFHRT